MGSWVCEWFPGAKINPSLILFIFLPALLFESSFYMDVHQMWVCLYVPGNEFILVKGAFILLEAGIAIVVVLYFEKICD